MAFELKQQLKLSQQLVMTPQLQQAIKLLQMTRLELQEAIQQELVENPVLEIEEGGGEGSSPEASEEQAPEKTAWEAYLEDYSSSQRVVSAPPPNLSEDLPPFENLLVKPTSLEDHLRWQLSLTPLRPEEKRLGELIVGNLSEEGYLPSAISLQALAKETQMELEDAEEVLKLIQRLDPVGVASRSLQECLQVQAEVLLAGVPWVAAILKTGMGDLEKKNYNHLAKSLKAPRSEVLAAVRCILDLNPKPGLIFQKVEPHYISPDVFVYKSGEDFLIFLNEEGLPHLKISSQYQQLVTGSLGDKTSPEQEAKHYVQDKMRAALWLIRSIHHRQKTLYRVTEALLKHQRAFFQKGPSALKPLILRDIADEIEMHESTVSRVTTNKFIHTSFGLFELKYFFNTSFTRTNGESIANEVIKDKIRALIQKEDREHPFSDQQLTELLEQQEQIPVARRTITKYREELGILSSPKRRQTLK